MPRLLGVLGQSLGDSMRRRSSTSTSQSEVEGASGPRIRTHAKNFPQSGGVGGDITKLNIRLNLHKMYANVKRSNGHLRCMSWSEPCWMTFSRSQDRESTREVPCEDPQARTLPREQGFDTPCRIAAPAHDQVRCRDHPTVSSAYRPHLASM